MPDSPAFVASQISTVERKSAHPVAFKTSVGQAAQVGFGFAAFYLIFRSHQYTAVDGALRSLTVFNYPSSWGLHGNNHMLYPLWMALWTRTAAWIGFGASDWSSFIGLCQALNSICAALTVAMLFNILQSIAGTRFAVLGSLQFGLSTAVVLHATNSAEPVVGLMFGVAALCLTIPSIRAESKVGFLAVGVLLTLALASYQLEALAAPMIAFACVCWPETRWRVAVRRLLLVGAGGFLSLIPLYATAYSSQGIPPNRMVAKFFVNDAGGFYAGFLANKLINPPIGMLRSLFFGVPRTYGGIRSLFKAPHAALWIVAVLMGLALLAGLLLLLGAGIRVGVRRSELPKLLVWSGVLLSVLGLIFPLYYGGPLYDKFWLLPLAAFAIAAGFAYRFFGSQPGLRKCLVAGFVILLAVEAARNIPLAVSDHVRQTANLDAARQLDALWSPQTSAVLDFDDISMLWLAIFGSNKDSLVLAAATKDAAIKWFAKPDRKNLLFVSVLDHDKESWDAFLKGAIGIPYSALDCYRQNSTVLRTYQLPEGPVTIRQLPQPSSCALTP